MYVDFIFFWGADHESDINFKFGSIFWAQIGEGEGLLGWKRWKVINIDMYVDFIVFGSADQESDVNFKFESIFQTQMGGGKNTTLCNWTWVSNVEF